jgi:hypothetical protein
MNTEETTMLNNELNWMDEPEPKVGNIYYLKNYTAPKVFTGKHYECALTSQKVARNAKIIQDLGSLKEWPYAVWKPKRFAAIGIEGGAKQAVEPGPEASPKESIVEKICVEALEKEPGWEIRTKLWCVKKNIGLKKQFKTTFEVFFSKEGEPDFWVGNTLAEGVKTMQDLRTLDKLVNG